MILKFGTSDVLNTTLIDASTGSLAYYITTDLLPVIEAKSLADQPPLRKTWIFDSKGGMVGKIGWQGRQPHDISIADETVGGLMHLFGSSTVRFQ
jgi:hypothetical protein